MAQVYRRKATRKDERVNTNMLDLAGGLFKIAGQTIPAVQENIKQKEILQQKQQQEEEKRLNQLQEDYVKRRMEGEIIDQEYLVADIGNKRAAEVNEITNGSLIAKKTAEQVKKQIDNGELVVGENQSPLDLYRQTLKSQNLTRNQLRGANMFLTNNAESILKTATESLSENSKLKALESFTASIETSYSTLSNKSDISPENRLQNFNNSYYQYEDEMVSQGLDIKDVRNKFYDYVESIADEDYNQAKFLIESLGTRTTKNGKQVRGFTKTDQRFDELIKRKEANNSNLQVLNAEKRKRAINNDEYILDTMNSGNHEVIYEDYDKMRIFYDSGLATANEVVNHEEKITNTTYKKIGSDVLRDIFIPKTRLNKDGVPVYTKQSDEIKKYMTNGILDIKKIKKNLPYIEKYQKKGFNISDEKIMERVKKKINIAQGGEVVNQEELRNIQKSIGMKDTDLVFQGNIMNTSEERRVKFITNLQSRASLANSLGIEDSYAKNYYNQITENKDYETYNNMVSSYLMLKEEFPETSSKMFTQDKINEMEAFSQLRKRAIRKSQINGLSVRENIEILREESQKRKKDGNLIQQSKEISKEQNVSDEKVNQVFGIQTDPNSNEAEITEKRSWVNQFFGSNTFTDSALKGRSFNKFMESHKAGATQLYNEGGYEYYTDALRDYSQINRIKDRAIVVGNNQFLDLGSSIVNQYQDTGQVEQRVQSGVDATLDTVDDLQDFITSNDEIRNIGLLESFANEDLRDRVEIRNTYDDQGRLIEDQVNIVFVGDEEGLLMKEIINNPTTREFLNQTIIGKKLIESNNKITIHDLYDYDRQYDMRVDEMNRKRLEQRALRSKNLPSLQPKL